MQLWPVLRSKAGAMRRIATSKFIVNAEEAVQSRRFKKAEEEFQTLKSLHSNGLITEEAFRQRKQDLVRSLQGTAK